MVEDDKASHSETQEPTQAREECAMSHTTGTEPDELVGVCPSPLMAKAKAGLMAAPPKPIFEALKQKDKAEDMSFSTFASTPGKRQRQDRKMPQRKRFKSYDMMSPTTVTDEDW